MNPQAVPQACPLRAQGFKPIKTNGLEATQYSEENAYYTCKMKKYVNMPSYQHPCFCGRLSVVKDFLADMVNYLHNVHSLLASLVTEHIFVQRALCQDIGNGSRSVF